MLYFIDIRFWEKIREFAPRVPKGRFLKLDEDSKIKRVCLSDSIAGCLTGVSWGGYNLVNDPPFTTGDLIVIARVYEFNKNEVCDGNLLKPNEVRKYVPDAEVGNEYWVVNQSIYPEKSYIIILRDYYLDFVVIEHGGVKYRLCKIKEPKFDILTHEQEDLLVNLALYDNKDEYFKKNYAELYKILGGFKDGN